MSYATANLPIYLQQYIAEQNYDLYTPIDHASWRYIMRVSREFFKDHAHPKYLDGLRETGVTIDRIPRISEMDEKLQKFGWRAVVITGFIPPEPFMEMLALRILPIASDMRKLENIDYTPAPDIVHEAAGHAPILADPSYSAYLKKFGEIARRVIFAKEDNQLYEAVLNLSETKENPASSKHDLELAQKRLDEAVHSVGYVSEAQQLTRLGWFSTEYGLIEKDGKHLIYGAGLLSSVGESYTCLNENVKKVPLTIDVINTTYDITKPQPQLFVTDDFKNLEKVIDELSERMAYKIGGVAALNIARQAQTLTTTVLDTGIHISGILTEYRLAPDQKVIYLKFQGPSQLSLNEIELHGHGPNYHKEGYISPLGMIRGLNTKPWLASHAQWAALGCEEGKLCRLDFESGISVEGQWANALVRDGKILLITFRHCTVKLGNEILFRPEWGTFDMALGESVSSVYGGAADRAAYMKKTPTPEFRPRVQKCNLTIENKDLAEIYGKVRNLRESASWSKGDVEQVETLKNLLDQTFPEDWLSRLELLEVLSLKNQMPSLSEKLRMELNCLGAKSSRLKMLIQRGLQVYS
jgi:phenylalanine-4-hydroxylase